jgi:hypothetical protein
MQSTTTIPKMGTTQKLTQNQWHDFRTRKTTVNTPAFTSIPPRSHHQKTTSKPPVFRKTPNKNANSPNQKKSRNINRRS